MYIATYTIYQVKSQLNRASIMHATSMPSLFKLAISPVVLLMIVYFCVVCCMSMEVSGRELAEATKNEHVKEVVDTAISGNNGEKLNCSDPKSENRTECSMSSDGDGVNDYVRLIINQMSENRGMLMRTLYVTLSVTGLVVAYFVVKSVWLRRKRSKSSMYGVASARGDRRDMEMKPLGDGNDDDDDDYTVFEANGRKR